jgi:hypothetical protein
MQELEKKNGTVLYKGKEYSFDGIEEIDILSLHIILSGEYKLFLAGDTKINGVICSTVESIKSKIQK